MATKISEWYTRERWTNNGPYHRRPGKFSLRVAAIKSGWWTYSIPWRRENVPVVYQWSLLGYLQVAVERERPGATIDDWGHTHGWDETITFVRAVERELESRGVDFRPAKGAPA